MSNYSSKSVIIRLTVIAYCFLIVLSHRTHQEDRMMTAWSNTNQRPSFQIQPRDHVFFWLTYWKRRQSPKHPCQHTRARETVMKFREKTFVNDLDGIVLTNLLSETRLPVRRHLGDSRAVMTWQSCQRQYVVMTKAIDFVDTILSL